MTVYENSDGFIPNNSSKMTGSNVTNIVFFGYQLYKKGLFHITPGIEYSYTGFRVKNNAPDYIPGNRNAISIKIMIGFGGK